MSLREDKQKTIKKVLKFTRLPYSPFRHGLYTVSELMQGYTADHPARSLDARIASHYLKKSKNLPDLHEALAQRIHDHAIDSALSRFVTPPRKPSRRIVGVMGGHSTPRDATDYLNAAILGRLLVGKGYYVVTGGGPGIMEAANLGAYLAHYEECALTDAIAILSKAPTYPGNETQYVATASEVRLKYKDSGASLAIPTWAYSSEPTGQFSSRIGKYFSNSIRKDGLLAIAAWGVVFCPGSAGTLQEIFQDAAHNSYWSFHSRGPMVCFNKSFFGAAPSIFDVLKARATKDEYGHMVTMVDTPNEVVDFIVAHPMRPEPRTKRMPTLGFSNQELRTTTR